MVHVMSLRLLCDTETQDTKAMQFVRSHRYCRLRFVVLAFWIDALDTNIEYRNSNRSGYDVQCVNVYAQKQK